MPLEVHLFFQLPQTNLHHHLFPSTLPNTYLQFHRMKTSHLLTRAASIGGSGAAEYPEQLIGGTERRRKRRSVAGVDQEELVDPNHLADPDSFFYEFNGVHIHHKLSHHEERQEEDEEQSLQARRDHGIQRLPMILLHGFGASVFSWDRVMRPLARITGSKVLAFDRPAFGLTSKVSPFDQTASGGVDGKSSINPYSMAFSVLATLSFLDLLGAGKAILLGHSAGCLVAVNTYFEAPERVAALILVAPAIVAPLIVRKKAKEEPVGKENQMDGGGLSSDAGENPIVRIWRGIRDLGLHLIGLALKTLKAMRDVVSLLFLKALSAILRSSFAVMLVRMVMDKFGILAVRNAWYDANQVTDHVIQGYTKPLRVKGWEMALLEYSLAMLTDSLSSKSMPPLATKLNEISCPVLIITGDTDRLIPSWNAERLALAIPGSTLEVIKNCGHLPHEEKAEEFLAGVERFLQRVFVAQGGQLSPSTPL